MKKLLAGGLVVLLAGLSGAQKAEQAAQSSAGSG